MSKDETRYVLNGMLFEQKGKSVVLCATDGRALGAYKLPVFPRKECSEKLLKFIVPATLISRIKVPKGTTEVDVEVLLQDGKTLISVITGDGFSIQCAAIDGTFPNWRQVVPLDELVREVNACFRPYYISQFDKARSLIAPERNAIRLWQKQNSWDSPLFVDIGNKDFTGVMMPYRMSDKELTFTHRSYVTNPET